MRLAVLRLATFLLAVLRFAVLRLGAALRFATLRLGAALRFATFLLGAALRFAVFFLTAILLSRFGGFTFLPVIDEFTIEPTDLNAEKSIIFESLVHQSFRQDGKTPRESRSGSVIMRIFKEAFLHDLPVVLW